MPICGEDDRLKRMLTDRDIGVKVMAKGKDPVHAPAGEIADQELDDESVGELVEAISATLRRSSTRGQDAGSSVPAAAGSHTCLKL